MDKKIIGYWAVTGLLALVLFGSGVGALTQQQFLIESMQNIGFPLYVMFILGTAYVCAAVALVVPKFLLLKEWAYAGIVFAMIGALSCHVFSGDGFAEFAPPIVIMSLAAASYVLRPPSRRLVVR